MQLNQNVNQLSRVTSFKWNCKLHFFLRAIYLTFFEASFLLSSPAMLTWTLSLAIVYLINETISFVFPVPLLNGTSLKCLTCVCMWVSEFMNEPTTRSSIHVNENMFVDRRLVSSINLIGHSTAYVWERVHPVITFSNFILFTHHYRSHENVHSSMSVCLSLFFFRLITLHSFF